MIYNHGYKVLLVDDERNILDSSESALLLQGIQEIKTLDDSRLVLPTLEKCPVSVLVLDLFMPYISGKDLIDIISQNYPHIPIIVMTAADDVQLAVDCMKSGAFDYLVKPVDNTRLTTTVKRALELCTLKNEVEQLKDHLLNNKVNYPSHFESIKTISKKMFSMFQYCEVVAQSPEPVTILGETGTGKELVARAIHDLSGRKGNYVSVNIASLEGNMFADSLFGHRKGAFTGADKTRPGLLAQAEGGTVFLDEIGDLALDSQVKLLRLLQEKEYYQVGSDTPLISDARILVATNRNLQELVAQGRFRNDLYFRLCTHKVHIPPLRERFEDIPVLLDFFIDQAAKSMNKKSPTYPQELITLLRAYDFPGNIREMKAMVFDGVARYKGGILSMESFKEIIGDRPLAPEMEKLKVKSIVDLLELSLQRLPRIKEVEGLLIEEAMKQANGNQGIAASLIGISRQTLNKRLQKMKRSDRFEHF